MKIPRQLPQFDKPALFLSSGEYEAVFFVANRGEFKEVSRLKMAPREEAREKQAFVGMKGGMQSRSAVSHRGRYIEDLKRKFKSAVHRQVHGLLATHRDMEEIFVFAPKYAAKRILAGLENPERRKIRMQFFGERTKDDPLQMIRIVWQTSQAAARFPETVSRAEKNILSRPRRRA